MKILVPTDFSACAKSAIDYAVLNFKDDIDELCLYHSVEMPYSGPSSVSAITDDLHKWARDKMSVFEKEMDEAYPDVNITSFIKTGSLFDYIETLEKTDYDLIVIGTTGASGLLKNIFGSNAYGVVKHAQIPVLSVPEETIIKRVENIMLASDFKDHDHEEKLTLLVSIVQKLNLNLEVFHVNHGDNYQVEDTVEFDLFKEKGIPYTLNIDPSLKEDLEASIIENSDMDNADILAIIPHHEGFLKSLFHRSMTKKMTMHSKIPVLVLK